MNESIELRDLRYFVTCCRTGKLSSAATQLAVAQPTLSHALARLEQQLGGPLLTRPRNRRQAMLPTERGQLVLRHAHRALLAIDELVDEINRDGPLSGHLSIGSMQSLNLTLLPPVVAAFARQHPQVHTRLHTYQATELPTAIRDQHLDIAISAGEPGSTWPDLTVRELFREPFVAIVRHDDPLARAGHIPMSALSERDFVLVPPTAYSGQVVHRACAQAGFRPRIRLELASGEALRETVRSGMGLTVLPTGYLSDHDPDLRAIRLTDPTPQRAVSLLSDPRRGNSRTVSAFVACLDSESIRRRQRDDQNGLVSQS